MIDRDEQIIVIDALESIQANPVILEIMDVSDDFYQRIINKLKAEWKLV